MKIFLNTAALIDEDIACAVPELTSGNYSCVNQDVAHATLEEKFGKYHEYYETVKVIFKHICSFTIIILNLYIYF